MQFFYYFIRFFGSEYYLDLKLLQESNLFVCLFALKCFTAIHNCMCCCIYRLPYFLFDLMQLYSTLTVYVTFIFVHFLLVFLSLIQIFIYKTKASRVQKTSLFTTCFMKFIFHCSWRIIFISCHQLPLQESLGR